MRDLSTDGSWKPVSPLLGANNAYIALAHFPEAERLKPIDLSDAELKREPTWYKSFKSFSHQEAAHLGILGAVKLDAAHSRITVVEDVFYGREKSVSHSEANGFIYGTMWGAGLRSRITISNFDASVDVSLPAIAAAASVGRVDAAFSLETIGVGDSTIMKSLPAPGRFDHEAMKALRGAQRSLEKLLVATKDRKGQPAMIRVLGIDRLRLPNPLAQAHLFGYIQLALQRPGRDAVKAAASRGLPAGPIEELYKLEVKQDPQGPPDQEGRERARRWLRVLDVDWEDFAS